MNATRTLLAAALASTLARLALAAPPPDLARRVEAVRSSVGVPGMAIAIVEND
ncbi:MAG: hypothetical protein JO361_09510, partial [Gammaproteobacteria bacterium]|nr:hypothetical protein [Gammaproteobacteria bacterium]